MDSKLSTTRVGTVHPGSPTRRLTRAVTDHGASASTAALPGSENLSGKTLGTFRLLKWLAQGGAGTVYAASNPRFKNLLAVKILHAEKMANKKDVAGMTNEYEIGRSLSHPGILKYIDFGTYEGRPFMVMEMFPGRAFNALRRTPDGAKAVRRREREIFTQMAEIVNYLHQQKVIHRDLKPDNFMVDLEHNQLKLIDFSVSERMTGLFRQLFTFGRTIIGTPSYMSPEHIEKKAPAPAMDIYSFGVMLFEHFAGRPPFVAATQNALLTQVLDVPAPKLSKFNPDVSPELEQLVARMLSKKPDERPVSMAHFINTFNRIKLYND